MNCKFIDRIIEWLEIFIKAEIFSLLRLAPAFGALHIRKITEEGHIKDNVNSLIEEIRSSFIDMLNNATWMDEDTKREAVDKAKSTIAHIGFPKELTNRTKIEEYYKSLALNQNGFLLNALRLKKLNLDYSLRQLREPVDKDDWLSHTMLASLGAANDIQKNVIRELNCTFICIKYLTFLTKLCWLSFVVMPELILRGAFISTDRPNYMNYGALGQVVGHEIAHGI